ncbi:hypothetical protein HZS_3716 [Henneguya salminicola]|nr:hypothetical protein HZS_3716 [Henneguya salminicola]
MNILRGGTIKRTKPNPSRARCCNFENNLINEIVGHTTNPIYAKTNQRVPIILKIYHVHQNVGCMY